MRAFVTLQLPDQTRCELTHGDLIGRLGTAALHIDDARVSEAHAMVSLRGSELKLLALRGRFVVEGKPQAELVLAPGQRVMLAQDLVLEVVDVELPETVLVLEGPGLRAPVLAGAVGLLAAEDGLRIGPPAHPEALLRIWSRDEGWARQEPGGTAQELVPGESLTVGGHRVHARERTLSTVASGATRQAGAIGQPLRIVCHHDVVHIHREGEPTLAFSGIGARIIAELAAFGGPVEWALLAGEVWPHVHDRHRLRRSLDVSLGRLRRRLERARIRKTLVNSDGGGKIALLLEAGDAVVDEG